MDEETGLYYYGARYYDPKISLWLSVDPLAEKYPGMSPYNYTAGNPINLVDPDGKEPIKPLVGKIEDFIKILLNSPRKVGYYKGDKAKEYVLSLGNTKFNWKQMRPLPTQTGYFNNKKGRYIYTEKGGWIDMVHFLFYAGKAYKYKVEGKSDPVGDAIQDGYLQERTDQLVAPHSAFSYEDLPSDKFGAEFGANYFDPNSKLTLAEQIEKYFNEKLKATAPEEAPNFEELPNKYPEKPTKINKTTKPIYTKNENDD